MKIVVLLLKKIGVAKGEFHRILLPARLKGRKQIINCPF
jgi:hypothetical protein